MAPYEPLRPTTDPYEPLSAHYDPQRTTTGQKTHLICRFFSVSEEDISFFFNFLFLSSQDMGVV